MKHKFRGFYACIKIINRYTKVPNTDLALQDSFCHKNPNLSNSKSHGKYLFILRWFLKYLCFSREGQNAFFFNRGLLTNLGFASSFKMFQTGFSSAEKNVWRVWTLKGQYVGEQLNWGIQVLTCTGYRWKYFTFPTQTGPCCQLY